MRLPTSARRQRCARARSGSVVVAADKWAGLGTDTSDDQQDIARGKGMVDSLFQGKGVGMGTQAREGARASWRASRLSGGPARRK